MSECVIGHLRIDGQFKFFTLEDIEREVKIPGKTAIPRGTYEVKITYSNRFKKPLPILLDVPGFEGVRIHAGNTSEDTEGCILLGMIRNESSVFSSALAMERFMPILEKKLSLGRVFIKINAEGEDVLNT